MRTRQFRKNVPLIFCQVPDLKGSKIFVGPKKTFANGLFGTSIFRWAYKEI